MFLTSSLRPVNSSRTLVGSNTVEHVQGAPLQQIVNYARYDDYARARLTIALLSHMSLDPLAGSLVEDFVDRAPMPDGTVGVYLQFYQVSNFIGSFAIPSSSPEWAQLKAAIGQNIASRMFKAASMHVRMRDKLHSRVRVLESRAGAVHKKALDDALAERNPQPAQGWRRPDADVLQLCYAIAQSARQAVFVAPRKRLDRRMEAVRVHAYDSGYRGSFYELQTTFAAAYLEPQSQVAALQ